MALPNELTLFKAPDGEARIRILHTPTPMSMHILKPRVGNMDCVLHGCPTCSHNKPTIKTAVTAVLVQSRQHNAKKNKGKVQYHKRVQKKWDKRVKIEGARSKLATYTKPVVAYLGKQVTDKLKELTHA